jgi:hypothetical protein
VSHQQYWGESADEDEEIDKAKEVTNMSREQAVEVRDTIFFIFYLFLIFKGRGGGKEGGRHDA